MCKRNSSRLPLPLICTRLGTRNPGVGLDLELNQRPFAAMLPNQRRHTSQDEM